MSVVPLKRLLEWFLDKEGWMVAVHNNYVQNGVRMTFWLFTRGSYFVKGEGVTDEEALEKAQRAAVELDERLDAEAKLSMRSKELVGALKYASSRISHHSAGCRGGSFARCRCSNAVTVRHVDKVIKRCDPTYATELEAEEELNERLAER